jgi:hypothetical protein
VHRNGQHQEITMRGVKQADCAIDLGLAISGATLHYGETRTEEEIAAYCGCSRQMINRLYQRGLKKLRNAQIFRKDPVLAELLGCYRDLLQRDTGSGEYRVPGSNKTSSYISL